jgi:hypothetical protein
MFQRPCDLSFSQEAGLTGRMVTFFCLDLFQRYRSVQPRVPRDKNSSQTTGRQLPLNPESP